MKNEYGIAPEDFYCYRCEEDLKGVKDRDWYVQMDGYGRPSEEYICDDCAASAYDDYIEYIHS